MKKWVQITGFNLTVFVIDLNHVDAHDYIV